MNLWRLEWLRLARTGRLVAVVGVSASALAFDARRESAVFLRTRVAGISAIVLPAYTMNVARRRGRVCRRLAHGLVRDHRASRPPAVAGRVAWHRLRWALLAFAVAAVAFVASVVRGTLAAAGVTLGILLGLALVGTATGTDRWLPTYLVGAMAGLVRDTRAVDYMPATAVTTTLCVVLLAGAIMLGARREV
jgi:ABC-2 type transport system permease protein